MSITSEEQLIDLSAIQSGCSKIEQSGKTFECCAIKVEAASAMCGEDVLSAEKKTMQPTMNELGEDIRQLQSYLVDFSKNIYSAAQGIYNEQYSELQRYRSLKTAEENDE